MYCAYNALNIGCYNSVIALSIRSCMMVIITTRILGRSKPTFETKIEELNIDGGPQQA